MGPALSGTGHHAERPFTVELAGIPGAGKSRLAEAVAAGTAARALDVTQPQLPMAATVAPVRRLSRKATAMAATFLGQPRLSVRFARSILHSGQRGLGASAARIVQWQVAQHVLGGPGSRRSVRIVDEGLLQCLWSIGLRGDVDPVIGALDTSSGWHGADLLVVVRTPPVVAEQRLASRMSRHSRTQHLTTEARLAELQQGEELLDKLVRWWAADVSRRHRVMEVSGSQGTADELGELVRRIVSTVEATPLPEHRSGNGTRFR